MRPEDALEALNRELAAAAAKSPYPNVDAVWAGFKAFISQPVDGVEDEVLYEIGVFGFGAPETFQLSLVRQLSFFDRGKYDHMEQVRCTVHFPPDDDLRGLGRFNTWAEQHESLGEFCRAVEQRLDWATMRLKRPTEMAVEQSQV